MNPARFVPDASVLVAFLVDGAPLGSARVGARFLAPTMLHYEVTNIIRRESVRGEIAPETQREALDDLKAMAIEMWPWPVLAARVWELRHNLTSYDASYVAVAELANATLITKDRRMAAAPGIRCPVEVMP